MSQIEEDCNASPEATASALKLKSKLPLNPLVTLPVRLHPKTTSMIRRMSSVTTPPKCQGFFDLPRELRDDIYTFYYSGNINLSSSHQPCSPHAAAILLGNRQLYDEARPILFKQAIFTINLAPKYARIPGRDLAYCLDHLLTPGELFTGSKNVFAQFKNIHLTLDSPRSGTKGSHWQQSVASLLITVPALPTRKERIHISVNLGNLSPFKDTTTRLTTLASRNHVPYNFNHVSRPRETNEELEARGLGRAWVERTTPKFREQYCRLVIMYYLGQMAHSVGAEMRLESSDRKKKRVVTIDTTCELLKLAEGLG
ncbi:hypothetical protein LTR36_006339 [Oleoguttula mirabilis]|uniref:Uncharacterized protein n=1 Tax=Oleoguttula mirabilis TaxID=1507867 RepID=A0AAV9JUE8_9PEZI|nr:hypothetical protein LTR36_006339 [Oleoguttula mirabilis]